MRSQGKFESRGESNVKMEQRIKDATPLALKMLEGAMSQRMQGAQAQEWERQEIVFWRLQREHSPANTQ